MPAKKISMDDLVAKFKERNNNREPRNAGELVQFSKKLRGFQPIGFGEARKYFEKQASPQRRRRPRPKEETKEPEEKQPEAATEQPDSPTDETATETNPEPATYQLEDEVKLTKDRTGIIRFIGPVDFAEGLFYGIELHSQFVGNSDGSKGGKRYFECAASRGIFVQENKIRRKMTKADHARKQSWLLANTERNSRKTPEPPEPTIAEEKEVETTAEPESPATEQKEVAEEVPADVPAESAEEAPAEEVAVEENVVEEEPPADQEQEENGEAKEDVAETVEQQPPVQQQLVVEEAESRPSYSESEEYYPAKSSDNLLQFVANQPDLILRSQLLDFFMRSNTNARLQMVFESLQVFPPPTQRNLLCVALLPRLERFADQ